MSSEKIKKLEEEVAILKEELARKETELEEAERTIQTYRYHRRSISEDYDYD